jgi:exopolysaccharide biosynthesis polyprenyl glycosylphosphotransferase
MARDVIQTINQNPESGYRIIGCLEPSEFPLDFNKNIQENVQMIGSAVHYKYHLLENTVDELVIATYPLTDLINIGDMIHFAEELGISVRIVPDLQLQQILFKPETARLQLKQFLGLPTISLTSTPESEMALVFKSFFDYLLALVGVVLLSPFFLLIAALIKTTSPGPIFYRQERCGLFARRFNVIKFRTMVNNAHSLRQNLNEINEMDGPVFKIKNDPRITLIGKFLRKTSFDELPQLFNVLMGHMSLVGPRPAIPEEVELYKPWQRRRLSMKPGLTCIWQVSGRNNIDFEQWMRMDLQYIDSWSIWLDFWILLKTVREVFLLHGR